MMRLCVSSVLIPAPRAPSSSQRSAVHGRHNTFMRLIPALYLCPLLAHVGFADQVTLKNGDRLSGAIQKNDSKNLTVKSELAGVVTIPWEAVTKVSAEQPLHVGLKDGQTVVGAVTTTADNSKFEIATKETGVVTAARGSVQFIRSK